MQLTDSQMVRLDLERKVVEKKFGGDFYLFADRYSEPYFKGWITTTCDKNDYELTLNLGWYFPDVRPNLYVTCPTWLRKYGGNGYLNDMGTSHDFHIWDTGPDNCIQICHSEHWDATHTCVGVLLKGALWLEFYDAYLRNGGNIDQYCHSFY